MNNLKEILNLSNLGWIQGRFTTNYTFSDLCVKNRQASEDEVWENVGGDTGYPDHFKIVFEFNTKIVAILNEKMTKDLLSNSGFDTSTKKDHVDLGQLMGCAVNLHFVDFYPESNIGTFYACLYEDGIIAHLDKI